MSPKARRRSTAITHTAIMIALVAAAILVASAFRLVYNVPTLADLFSISAIPIALAIYHLARLLTERSRAAHETTLREKDEKDIEHAKALIRTCRSAARGISRSPTISAPSMLALTQNLATTIATIKAQYGHLLTTRGKRAAEKASSMALQTLEAGEDCLDLNTSYIARELRILSKSVLPLDDESLVERRRRAADAGGPA